jgi:tetratricopeptide (TPR) repeat protein
MALDTALDRLLQQQIQLASKGEVKTEQVREQVLDLWQLGGPRPAGAYVLGYAKMLLSIDIPDPPADAALRRWHLFGRLRAHDRKGERTWVAELLQDPQTLVDLLSDPEVAAQVLPLAVRTLFWCGDLKQALRAVQYLAAERSSPDIDLVVDAAITDLLTRLESRVDADDQESTASILHKVLDVAGFDRLPADVRARYHKALAERLLAGSEWKAADQHAGAAVALAQAQPRLQSSARALQALAALRVHSIEEVEPHAARPERAAALPFLAHVEEDPDQASPQALLLRALFDYETGHYGLAARGLDKAIEGMRRVEGRDLQLLDRARFFQAAALLAEGRPEESSRALQLMAKALDTVHPDLESFYAVHEALKKLDRKLALRFLDAVDVGRGTSPDQLLFVALEYLSLGEAAPASRAAQRVLEVGVDLDQRLEAMRVVLTAHNMVGEQERARACYAEMRELLLQRGAFEQLERLLKNETAVGQALDHVEIKVELAALYEEMEGRDYERAQLQIAVARSLRARKETESLRQAYGLLQEVACSFPELAKDDLQALERILELNDAAPPSTDTGAQAAKALGKVLGHPVRVLVVGGNERQRRHHPRFEQLAETWGFQGEWVMTNYTSPQKVVGTVADRLRAGIDVLVLLHWNRHETTEPALDLARKADVPARTVHYAGFTSLQVALGELLEKMAGTRAAKAGSRG